MKFTTQTALLATVSEGLRPALWKKKSLTVVDAFVRGDFCYFSKQKACIKMSKRNYF